MLMDRKKTAQLIIARLDGNDIKKRFSYYHSLVKKGIGGFIIFGGDAKDVRDGVRKLQKSADTPLFISSDLERGLGQHIDGGTLFPHAMAIAHAVNRKKISDIELLKKAIKVMAEEAKAVGINTIFSPVMDVNTNPKNPIICTRAFSDTPEEAAWFGKEFIKGFQNAGIIACAKHFPGHGDTSVDSHKELPVLKANMKRLNKVELYPFAEAIKANVKMVMIGHLMVPAIDPDLPSSLSHKTVTGLLRKKMGYKGLVITDAMNMQAVSGKTKESEGEACMKALLAGADMILHPSDPEYVIDHLSAHSEAIVKRLDESYKKVLLTKNKFHKASSQNIRTVGSRENRKIAHELAKKAVNDIKVKILSGEKISLLVIDDDDKMSGKEFVKTVKGRLKNVSYFYVNNKNKKLSPSIKDTILIASVFSSVAAWKGRSSISTELMDILKKSIKASKYSIVIGFCSPYILEGLEAETVINAYSDTDVSQETAGEIFSKLSL
ncbi:MAG: glycoside hydrolase family 3 protein [Thermodesulfovibrionia bacterium]|nr:glycoside hydrolase family 3 protein [Thermodesulfovibrionia bacterium]